MDIIPDLVNDLRKYSKADINLLAKLHQTTDLMEIAEANLALQQLRTMSANMPRTYTTDQIADVVNWINAKTESNICLRHMLVITTYTDKPHVAFLGSKALPITLQEYDMYDNSNANTAGTDNPMAVINDLISVSENPRICMFVLWVKRDSSIPQLPVLDSHLTLAIFQKGVTKTDVYKYNSSITDTNAERALDMLFLQFLTELHKQTNVKYNLLETTTWCPLNLQRGTDLCTVFAFNIYHNLNKYRKMSIQHMLEYNVQSTAYVAEFFESLSKAVPGLGIPTDTLKGMP